MAWQGAGGDGVSIDTGYHGPGFGRIYIPDERDNDYPIRTISKAEQKKIRKLNWAVPEPLPLNQGRKPMCGGYSASGLLVMGPVRNKIYKTPEDLYHEAQKIDGINHPHDGTTVRAVMKVLSDAGYFSEYRWAQTVDDVTGHLLSTGPVLAGTSWFDGMMQTTPAGWVKPVGAKVGGHAYLLIGCDLDEKCPDGTKGSIRCLNSWGKSFGKIPGYPGRFKMSIAQFDRLLQDRGEAVVGHEVKLVG